MNREEIMFRTLLLAGVGVAATTGAQSAGDIVYYAPDSSEEVSLAAPIPREIVPYDGPYSAGTIIVRTSERRLYFVLSTHEAIKYGIGVGRPGFTWTGASHIDIKREWPDWTPPPEMLERRPDLPDHMEGGIDNPLGARALYIAGTLFRIHGSNEPESIGKAVSSGCIRMANPDVIDLYSRVKLGTPVVVIR
jgi:lipoprotein-anchoring transpeptidase ErfK/SrfK